MAKKLPGVPLPSGFDYKPREEPNYDPEKDVDIWLRREGLKWAPSASVWETDKEEGLDLSDGHDPVIGDAQDAEAWYNSIQNRTIL